jgi:hypothetical protein
MAVEQIFRFLPVISPGGVILLGVLSTCLWIYRSWARLRHVPGPLFASISNFQRLTWAWSGKAHETHIRLHERYGKLVRLGPNCVSIGDPHEISKIYGTGANMTKVRIRRGAAMHYQQGRKKKASIRCGLASD